MCFVVLSPVILAVAHLLPQSECELPGSWTNRNWKEVLDAIRRRRCLDLNRSTRRFPARRVFIRPRGFGWTILREVKTTPEFPWKLDSIIVMLIFFFFFRVICSIIITHDHAVIRFTFSDSADIASVINLRSSSAAASYRCVCVWRMSLRSCACGYVD